MYNTYFLYTAMPIGHYCAGRWLHLTFRYRRHGLPAAILLVGKQPVNKTVTIKKRCFLTKQRFFVLIKLLFIQFLPDLQHIHRVYVLTVYKDLEMHMRTGAVTAAAHKADDLAFAYALPRRYSQAAHMSVSRFITVAMVDTYITAITAVPASHLYRAHSTGINRFAKVNSDINARMPVVTTTDRPLRPP